MRREPFVMPDTIRIRGKMWTIKRGANLDRIEAPTHPGEKFYAVGAVDERERAIELSRDVEGTREEAVTLVHELMHACSRRKVDHEVEERFVDDIDRALLGALEQLRWKQ